MKFLSGSVLLLFALAALAPDASAQVKFVPTVHGSVGAGAYSGGIADFSGEGKADLAAPAGLGATPSGINFALTPGGVISGTVTSSATGLPIASVSVSVFNSTGAWVTSASTNASGLWVTSTGLPTGTYYARTSNSAGYLNEIFNDIASPGDSFSTASLLAGTPIAVTTGATTSGINFALTPGGIISGTVTSSATGLPIAGVLVFTYNSAGDFMTSASTNASGVWATSEIGLPTGTYFARTFNFVVYVDEIYNDIASPGGSGNPLTGTPIAVTTGATTSGINFALTPGGVISGTVTSSATGLPIASVTVSVYNSAGAFMTSASTNASGVWAKSETGLPTGTYYARTFNPFGYVDEIYNDIASPGFSGNPLTGTPIAVTTGATTSGINFALTPGGVISGTVTSSATGLSIASVTVFVYNSTGAQVAGASTNASGVWATSSIGLPTGTYFARTSNSAGYLNEIYNDIANPFGSVSVVTGTPIAVTTGATTSGIDFALTPGGIISGTVTSSATGLPISSVTVFVYNSTGASVTSAFTNASGLWVTSTGLPTGTYYARTFNFAGYVDEIYNDIASPGFSGNPLTGTPIAVTTGATTSGIDFALTPGGIISGTVTSSATGLPIASVSVSVFNSTGASVTSASTNASGLWVTSTGLPTGTYYARTSNSAGYLNEIYNDIANPFGSVSVVTGTPIAVTTGATTSGIDFALTPAPAGPFGQVDTPSQNAAGVQGAIGVTGWALDDVGVAKVEIFRNCLGFELANCQTVLGNSVVYIGDAVFVTGARPDVAAAFPTYPNKNSAGWGFMMLTPMLPHVINSQPYGGQGALTIYAIATDTNGNKTVLGRSWDPASPSYATPTAIGMTNDTIAKPFGAIDTPGQGQTIGGVFNNFGWAITPDSNTTGGEGGDILIPINGSTMTVFIDALPVALVAYNQCRGTVGNPVPGGVFCNDDVANIFGNPTPQAPLTSRTSNPTKFRNLDGARAAIGAYTFNTATLSNGLHTIAWSVSDSLARNEGIGSRFFIVSNGAASPLTQTTAFAAPQVLGAAATLEHHSRVTGRVWGRTGFDLGTAWTTMHARDDGTFVVRLTELGRLELWFGDVVDAGYVVANGTLQPLPVGATLAGPRFGWMPPAGYTGPYQLAFVRGGERIDVTVTVVETPRVRDGEAQIRMQLDAATPGAARVGHLGERTVRLDGWAFDPQAAIGAGIGAVHVWATRHGDTEATPFFLGSAALDQPRPDVAQSVTGAPTHAGFSLTASLAPGTYTVTAYVWNQRTARWEDARSVTVTVR